MPKISIVVPVYNVEKYLKHCLDSLLGQTFTDYELILVDDGSTDSSGDICEEYKKQDGRIRVFHKTNGGLSDARNTGIDWVIANSNSEWITFVDSDDYVHPQYLHFLYEAAVENECNISCCYYLPVKDYKSLNSDRIELKSFVTTAEELFCFGYDNPYKDIRNCAWAKLYKTRLFESIRYPFGRLFEDAYTTHLLLFPEKRIAIVDGCLYYYFFNPNSITNTSLTPKKIEDRYDSKICRLDYFYRNNYFRPFMIVYYECCEDIQKYLLLYTDNDELIRIAKEKKNELFSFITGIDREWLKVNYYSEYKKRLKKTKEYFKRIMHSDYHNNMSQVGAIKARLYYLKQYIKLMLYSG